MLLNYLVEDNAQYAIDLLSSTMIINNDDMLKSLAFACSKNLPDVVLSILRRGANTAANCEIAMPPLLCAIEHGNTNIINILLDNGVDVNEYVSGSTPLHYAVDVACDVEQQSGNIP